MARPKNDGLMYFPFDTDFFYADRRIKALRSRFGNDGVVLLIWIWSETYRENGYYLRWDEDAMDNAISDLGITEGLIEQVMTFLCSRSLLDKVSSKLAASDTIYTSPGIQKRFQEAAKAKKRDILVDSDIWLLDHEDTATCIKFTQNVDYSEKNHNKSEKNHSFSKEKPIKEIKVKESKINNTPYNPPAGNGDPSWLPENTFKDPEIAEAFQDFLEYRSKIGSPVVTEKQKQLLIQDLMSIAGTNGSLNKETAKAVINQSITNGWKKFYELKKDKKQDKRNAFCNFEERDTSYDDTALDDVNKWLKR